MIPLLNTITTLAGTWLEGRVAKTKAKAEAEAKAAPQVEEVNRGDSQTAGRIDALEKWLQEAINEVRGKKAGAEVNITDLRDRRPLARMRKGGLGEKLKEALEEQDVDLDEDGLPVPTHSDGTHTAYETSSEASGGSTCVATGSSVGPRQALAAQSNQGMGGGERDDDSRTGKAGRNSIGLVAGKKSRTCGYTLQLNPFEDFKM